MEFEMKIGCHYEAVRVIASFDDDDLVYVVLYRGQDVTGILSDEQHTAIEKECRHLIYERQQDDAYDRAAAQWERMQEDLNK
jgi:hypothetical protein